MASSILKFSRLSTLTIAVLFTQPAWSADAPSAPAKTNGADTVLVKNALTAVTKQDFEIELSRFPEDYRGDIETSAPRIAKILDGILLNKTLAAQARQLKFDSEPEVKKMVDWLIQKALAQLRLERLELEAAAEFDTKQAEYEARAKELYKTNQAKYLEPATVSASHVLIGFAGRSKEAALKRAQEVQKLAKEGKSFEELAVQYSDDPSVKQNKGDLGTFGKGKMVRAFEDAVYALNKAGEISAPIETQFGFHVIRLNAKAPPIQLPYEVARPSIMAELKSDYVKNVSSEHTKKIMTDKAIVVNEAAIASLRKAVPAAAMATAKPEPAKP